MKRKGNWRINARGRVHNGRLSLFRARLSRSRALLFPLSPPLQMPTMQAFHLIKDQRKCPKYDRTLVDRFRDMSVLHVN